MPWCSRISVKHIFSCVFAYNSIISCCTSEKEFFAPQIQIKERLIKSSRLLFFFLNAPPLGFENVWGFQVIPIIFTVFLYNCRREYYIKVRDNRVKDFASFSQQKTQNSRRASFYGIKKVKKNLRAHYFPAHKHQHRIYK